MDARGIEVKPAQYLHRATGAIIASDALRALSSSLDVRKYGSLGGIAIPSYRGLPSEYNVVYRDGVRTTNEQLGLTDLGQLTLRGVSHIELLPANTAIFLGGDAIGASLDLVTEVTDSTIIEIGTDQTNFERTNELSENSYFASTAVRVAENLALVGSGSADLSNGRFPFYQAQSHSTIFRENNDASIWSGALHARWETDASTTLTLSSNYFSADRGLAGAAITPYRGASSLDERQTDRQFFSAIKVEHTDDNWDGSIATHFQSQYESFLGKTEGLGDSATNSLLGINASLHAPLTEWLAGYAGVNYLYTNLTGSSNAKSGSASIDRSNVLGYAALQLSPAQQIRIAASMRGDYVSDTRDLAFLPQTRIEYEPASHLTFSGSYSRNFHAPH